VAERKRNQGEPTKKQEPKDAKKRAKDLDAPTEKAARVQGGKRIWVR
jgi:hypothetical protein